MITHNLGIISELCQNVAVMYAGRIIEYGSVKEVFHKPAHPYTRGLIGALPTIHETKEKLTAVPGRMADAQNLPSGCPFHPRCEHCKQECKEHAPDMQEVAPMHLVACCNAS